MEVLTNKERRLIKRIFDSMDEGKTGYVSVDKLGLVIKKIGFIISEHDEQAIIYLADEEKRGKVTFDEFHRAALIAVSPANLLKARCRLAYSALCPDTPTYISRDDLRKVLTECNVPLPVDDIMQLYDAMRRSTRRDVAFEDFLNEFLKAVVKHTV